MYNECCSRHWCVHQQHAQTMANQRSANAMYATAEVANEDGKSHMDSEFAFECMQKWVWGSMSAIEIVKLAMKSNKDHVRILKKLKLP